ncbi:MAG: ABC transporter permease subunit [Planctomycetaceae bacterium]|nr:ABC transporter permease subunit [Planctomycetaceae bacterium]
MGILMCLVCSGCRQNRSADAPQQVTIASKVFTESVVLGELARLLVKETGAETLHRRQGGGTQVLWNGLLEGSIDVYPEYTGTMTQEMFTGQGIRTLSALRTELAKHGIAMSRPLGFNNTYALGMQKKDARRLGIRTISDLRQHPDLRVGFSNEFMERADGWPALKDAYSLPQTEVRGLNHDLAYRGLESDDIDLIDCYTTDAEIEFYDLAILEDDREFFPEYNAVLLYRQDLETRAPEVVASLLRLEGGISEAEMIAMNASVKIDQQGESRVAARWLQKSLAITATVQTVSRTSRLVKYTLQHLYLVGLSVSAAIVLAVPLGILAARSRTLGQGVLATVGILQTIPSLVLFVVLIPFLGLGPNPAIFALFLYSLLPIVRNTVTGLAGISRPLHESAAALGLGSLARLRLIELPLASPAILAGIKTAVVINIGTATLGGFIGAGGYGDPIFTGIRLDRTDLLLEGAVPAALMALLAQGFFELVERVVVPRGLRLKSTHQ